MAQPSVYFSAGRLTMLQRNVLDAAGMERLLSTAVSYTHLDVYKRQPVQKTVR